jgi:hypothetical protein
MISDFRLLSTIGGVTYFARVWVCSEDGSDTTEVIDAISEVNPDVGEVNSAMEPLWVNAALQGARDAVAELKKQGLVRNECIVKITKIVGSVLDTRQDVVRCAAAIATWKSLCPKVAHPKPKFESGTWKLL